jgi:hypothetical protein
MLVLLADTFTVTVTVTTISGPVVLLVSLHWLHWCSFPGRLLASNWTVRNCTITSFPSPYLELTELFGTLSMEWYSLGADHIENTASNYTSIVERGPLHSNGSSTVAYLRSCSLPMNLWQAGFLGNTLHYFSKEKLYFYRYSWNISEWNSLLVTCAISLKFVKEANDVWLSQNYTHTQNTAFFTADTNTISCWNPARDDII